MTERLNPHVFVPWNVIDHGVIRADDGGSMVVRYNPRAYRILAVAWRRPVLTRTEQAALATIDVVQRQTESRVYPGGEIDRTAPGRTYDRTATAAPGPQLRIYPRAQRSLMRRLVRALKGR